MTWEVAQQLAVNREGWRRRDDDDEMMMPISTNRDVINRDNVTRMILSSARTTTDIIDQSEKTSVTDDRNIAVA